MENGAVTDTFPLAATRADQKEARPGDGFLESIVLWDSMLFGLVCLLDMISTVYLVVTGVAREGNPWLAYWMDQGVVSFVAVKLLTFLPTLAVAAYYRIAYPRFIGISLRIALVAYIAIYVVSVGKQLI